MTSNKRYSVFAKVKTKIARVLGRSKLRITLRMFLYNLSMLFTFRKFVGIENDDIYDYKKSIMPKRLLRRADYYGNIMYGADYTLNLFCGKKSRFKGYFEHGLYLGEAADEANNYRKHFKRVITFSTFRINSIHKVNPLINVFAIGPYIHYAISKSDDFIAKEKKRNGKTLLVFPQHSTDNISVEFDIMEMIEKIEALKAKFDFKTVLVCLYFRDIISGKDFEYLKKGYRVVSSGYKEDPLFLARQKTFLLMSDGVLTNDIGTYVGYAIYYKKPVCLFSQKKSFTDMTGIENSLGKSVNDIIEGDRNTYLESLFSTDDMIITSDQHNACSLYWGFNHIKSKEQLCAILSNKNNN